MKKAMKITALMLGTLAAFAAMSQTTEPPGPVKPGPSVVGQAWSEGHTVTTGFGATEDGRVLVWGYRWTGQSGNGRDSKGTLNDRYDNVKDTAPTYVKFFDGLTPETYAVNASGTDYALFALTSGGQLYGWGYNTYGATGCPGAVADGSGNVGAWSPNPDFMQVTHDGNHDGAIVASPCSIFDPINQQVLDYGTGAYSGVALVKDKTTGLNEVWAWGHNQYGQLGWPLAARDGSGGSGNATASMINGQPLKLARGATLQSRPSGSEKTYLSYKSSEAVRVPLPIADGEEPVKVGAGYEQHYAITRKPVRDGNGNIVYETDQNGVIQVDGNGNPVPSYEYKVYGWGDNDGCNLLFNDLYKTPPATGGWNGYADGSWTSDPVAGTGEYNTKIGWSYASLYMRQPWHMRELDQYAKDIVKIKGSASAGFAVLASGEMLGWGSEYALGVGQPIGKAEAYCTCREPGGTGTQWRLTGKRAYAKKGETNPVSGANITSDDKPANKQPRGQIIDRERVFVIKTDFNSYPEDAVNGYYGDPVSVSNMHVTVYQAIAAGTDGNIYTMGSWESAYQTSVQSRFVTKRTPIFGERVTAIGGTKHTLYYDTESGKSFGVGYNSLGVINRADGYNLNSTALKNCRAAGVLNGSSNTPAYCSEFKVDGQTVFVPWFNYDIVEWPGLPVRPVVSP